MCLTINQQKKLSPVLAVRYCVTFRYWHRNSVCLSLCRLSVMLVHSTQRDEFFRNIFAPHFSTAILLGCKDKKLIRD